MNTRSARQWETGWISFDMRWLWWRWWCWWGAHSKHKEGNFKTKNQLFRFCPQRKRKQYWLEYIVISNGYTCLKRIKKHVTNQNIKKKKFNPTTIYCIYIRVVGLGCLVYLYLLYSYILFGKIYRFFLRQMVQLQKKSTHNKSKKENPNYYSYWNTTNI